MAAISFVIPVKNGAAWIEDVLRALLAEAKGHEYEIIIVDDGSSDESAEILQRFGNGVRVIQGEKRGAARAINLALQQARHPLIAQLDQDVRIQPGWLDLLLSELEDPEVAAAQGHYIADADASLWARVMGLDLAQRYARPGKYFDHVCTGNTIYRAEALKRVGYLDEDLGYGYDNDLSYRLIDAGYKLVRCGDARSVHQWRDTLPGYLAQQYGMGYGRIDLVFKHSGRYRGDDVSGFLMMLHAPLLGLALLLLSAGAVMGVLGHSAASWFSAGVLLLAFLVGERSIAGITAARRFEDRTGLWFPAVHLVRDVAWLAAMTVWSLRRILGIRGKPRHSMMR